MLKRGFLLFAVVLLAAFVMVQTQVPLVFAQSSTPTPAPAEEEAPPDLTTLLERIDQLEERVAALEDELAEAHEADHAEPGADAMNQVAIAVYLMESAGLHALDVRLNEGGEIEPGDAGRVERLTNLLATVDWPEELAADAEALLDTFMALAEALADDDADAAAPLATQAHDDAHALAHAAETLLTDDDHDHGDQDAMDADNGEEADEEDEDAGASSGGG